MAEGEVRIGVYICHCGLNIAGVADVKEVAKYAGTLPNVVVSRDYVFMCSEPGQNLIREDIKAHKLNRIVVAACSPTMHLPTFRSAAESAGLNKYLVEMANIREHCTWVHPDKAKATEKAKDLVRMAVAKARLLEPVEDIISEAVQSVLVLGGGVAGMKAAMEAARAGFNAIIVEKRPTLGGMAARVGWISRDLRGIDIVKEMIASVSQNPRITVFTNAKLVELSGYPGNFSAKIQIKPRYVNEKCTLCGECLKACPIEVNNEYEFGLSKRKAIYHPFDGAYPNYYVIDLDACNKCGKCVEVCKPRAIDLNQKEAVVEVKVGSIILATGYDEYVPPRGEFGYGLSNRVVTLFQLERLLDPDGPTKGQLLVDGVRPKSIAFILCVGSRGTTSNAYLYCSRMCCTASIWNALRIKDKYPEAEIYILYRDIMTYGTSEEIYEEASKKLIRFLKYEKPPTVEVAGGRVKVTVYESTLQDYLELEPDLVVLANGMRSRSDVSEVTSITRASVDQYGFFREVHLKLAPAEAPSKGLYLAGACSGPKNIIESIKMGGAAAAKAIALISKGKITLEPLLADVNKDKCSGCGVCVSVCPYGAIKIERTPEGDRVAKVEKTLCMGCGTCAAACPSGAMRHIGFTDEQVRSQVITAFSSR